MIASIKTTGNLKSHIISCPFFSNDRWHMDLILRVFTTTAIVLDSMGTGLSDKNQLWT